MLLVTYDITDDKLRTKFSNFLKKFGYRLQYSVFEIKNSERILNLVMTEIQRRYMKHFTGADSVMIIPISESDEKKIMKFGYAKNTDEDILFL
ncbi:CRISPR-associated endonuclease Cas2 [Candidatus Gracilibacteria bacterium]|nr:CRISPR-associated endonuclease Cas2 [Candidatus Gracilibacteria bacterium]